MNILTGKKEIKESWFLRRGNIAAFAIILTITVASGWYHCSIVYPEQSFSNLKFSQLKISILKTRQAAASEKKNKRDPLTSEGKSSNQKEAGFDGKQAKLDQETIILAQREDILSPKDEFSAEQEAVTPDQDDLTLTLDPASLAENCYLPQDSSFVILDCSTNKASIWQGTDSKPLLKSEIDYEWPFGEGLFVVGNDAEKGDFVFYHMSFFWNGTSVVDTNFWKRVAPLVQKNNVPLVAYSSAEQLNDIEKTDISMAEQTRKIRQVIFDWAEAWRRMDVDSLVDFYGNIFTCYFLDMDKPLVFAREQFRKIKEDILGKSEFVLLNISDPICIINPENPKVAIAVFDQHYRSSIYSDQGTKVLYFILVDEPDEKQNWKMVAKLWLPR